MITKRKLFLAFALTVYAGLLAGPVRFAVAQDEKQDVVVFAAASLKNALDEIASRWQKETGNTVKISYAASSVLAKQLEQDAPAQVFISADLDWMDYVAGKDLIKSGSRVNLLGNRLVLVVPKDSKATIEIAPGFDLAKVIGDGKLAMGTVNSVPAGKYGKAALEKLGAWDAVAAKVAQADNVRAALLLVARNEAAMGIVYESDARSEPNVKTIGVFPEGSHPPIVYPAALTKKATGAGTAFLAFVESSASDAIFKAQGFSVLR